MKKIQITEKGASHLIAGIFPEYDFREVKAITEEKIDDHYEAAFKNALPRIVESYRLTLKNKADVTLVLHPNMGEMIAKIIDELQTGINRPLSEEEILEIGVVIGSYSVNKYRMFEGETKTAKLMIEALGRLPISDENMVNHILAGRKAAKEVVKSGKVAHQKAEANSKDRAKLEELLHQLFK